MVVLSPIDGSEVPDDQMREGANPGRQEHTNEAGHQQVPSEVQSDVVIDFIESVLEKVLSENILSDTEDSDTDQD